MVSLSWSRGRAARHLSSKLSAHLGGWARSPGVAALLMGRPEQPAAVLDPALRQVEDLLDRLRQRRSPDPAILSHLGRLLAVDYLLVLRIRRRRVRASLFSVHLGRFAPCALRTRLPDLPGLRMYLRTQTASVPFAGGSCTAASCPGRKLGGVPLAEFTYDELRRSRVQLSPGFWMKTISGYGRLDVSTMVPDDRVSLTKDLGLDESYTFAGRIDVQVKRGHHLRFGYTPSHFSAREIMERSARLSGRQISIHEMIETDVYLNFFELSYLYDLVVRDFFTVSLGLQVNVCDTGFMIEDLGNTMTGAKATNQKMESQQTVPIPYLGLRLEYFPMRRLGIVGEVKAFSVGSTFTVVDVEIGARLNPFRNFSVFGGYRFTRFDLEVLDQELHFGLEGPFFLAAFHLWTGAFQ